MHRIINLFNSHFARDQFSRSPLNLIVSVSLVSTMPAKVKAGSKKGQQAASPSAKSALKHEQAASPSSALQPAAEDTKDYAINAPHYARVQEALTILESTPGMDAIQTASPLTTEEGAAVSPFDPEEMKAKLDKGEPYFCGATLFFSNPLRDASPGVPIDGKQIDSYMEHNFGDVDKITNLPRIEIACEAGGTDMVRVSPSEPIHALIFAASKAMAKVTAGSHDPVAAGEVIFKWKKILRSLPTTIRLISGESARFFASVQSRIDAVVEASAVGRQPCQWAAEIVLHRDRMWRQQGGRAPPGAAKVAENLVANLNFKGLSGSTAVGSFSEKITTSFVDNCITVYDRLIQHAELIRLVLKYPNVWDTMNKLHVLVYKAGSRQNIQWVLEMLDDLIANGLLKPEDISRRCLRGADSAAKTDKGLVAFLLAKRVCKDYLMQHAQKTWSGWQPEAFVKMHEVFANAPKFREEMSSLSWQRPFRKSNIRFLEVLETLMVGDTYDEQLRAQVNNSRSPAEYHVNMADLKRDLAEVQTMYDEEAAALQAQMPAVAIGDDGGSLTSADAVPASAASDSQVSGTQKMAASLFPKVPFAALGPFLIAAERRIKRTWSGAGTLKSVIAFGFNVQLLLRYIPFLIL